MHSFLMIKLHKLSLKPNQFMETTTATSPTIASANYASFGARLLAVIIDVIIIGVLQSVVIGPILGMLGLGIASQVDSSGNISEEQAIGMVGAAMAAMGSITLIAWAISILYFAIMESSKAQASVGKMALGIKVTDMDGNKISFGKGLLRSIGRIISQMILFIGYLMAAFTEKKQALHDMIAGTLVVKK
jgi:uncharacterized RDD family membrane protein YckC